MSRLPPKWSSEWKRRETEIKGRLDEFSRVPVSEHFYELCFCILTPQSKARHAERVVCELKCDKFYERGFDPTPYLRNPKNYIRFHNTKSKRLLRVRAVFPKIAAKIHNSDSSVLLRRELIELIPGFGMKESSHFLRNIGVHGLAIIDRHVAKHLKQLGLIPKIPKTISKKQYLEIEKKWHSFAKKVGISLDELDLLFWSMETGEVRK
ncbi:hypothetical protein A2852_00315 [Candidatus Adlerbacteria bacterium RIFCSPHIGHO2_01_FULL_54_23]|uniref:HhH-GPD domain-containing protein n=3 Tax=Candidatus Adleribacteriota TaxID=1752736 RepID=A0A1F4XZJ8_9BACT|nr:MAG: Endonuclease III [Candidatus Adlerbacteria bacterium GW2011_GWA1_54_10]KKW38073.1 MAG: Endonuclease III [Candidatus Adlerbacteria bacterium GW2011_GWB1_54_7]OGC78792.1 MAG: hypothetical protein A2852_00315 [Candidatus Adlerbacteria bacterium RIFCSPHIGHO2_01_FULL_54_23]OGC87099.1 MAG: hypothetical protein A3B33_00550 [Candidatus Adlerbacteria bacterium RIFCSPLOWO2_01_FULL_54_16]